MSNEVLLLLSVLIIYGSTLIFLKVFGKQGLYCFTSRECESFSVN